MNNKQIDKRNISGLLYGHWSIVLLIFTVWVIIVATNYYHYHPIILKQLKLFFNLPLQEIQFSVFFSLIMSYLFNVLLLGLLLVISFALGRKILRWMKVEMKDFWMGTLFSIGIGLGILSYLTFGLGFLGLLYRWFFWALVIIFSAAGFFEVKRMFQEIGKNPQIIKSENKKFALSYKAVWVLLGILIFINLCMSFVPELFYDSLYHHLGIPNYYIIKHKILPLRYVIASFYPPGMEMLYLMAMLLSGDILAKLIHFSCGILTLIAIYHFCKKYFNRLIGLISCAIFYTVPIVSINSWATGNDVCLAFIFMLSLWAMIEFFNKDQHQKKWLFLSAILAGFCMSIKYPALFSVLGLMSFAFLYDVFGKKSSLSKSLKMILIYGLIALAVTSPWLIRNFVYIKNPFFPFFCKLSGGEYLQIRQGASIFYDTLHTFGKISEVLTSPWFLTMKGYDSLHFVGPLFLLLIPLFFFIKRKEKIAWHLFNFSLLAYFFFLLATKKPRYLMPAFPAMSIIAAYGLITVMNNMPRYIGRTIVVGFSFVLMTNIYSILSIIHFNYSPFKVLTGIESRDDYLSYSHPGVYPYPAYSVFKYVNERLPVSSKILVIGDEKVYYIKRDFVFNAHSNKNLIIEWCKQAKNPENLYNNLKKEKISHLLINLREGMRLHHTFFYWKNDDLKVFNQFWDKYVKKIYVSDNNVFLYEVMSEEEVSIPHQPPFNFLAELHKQNYKQESLLKIFMKNEMWDYAINEYKFYARFGQNVYSQLGYLYFRKGDYREAIRMYRRAVEKDPNFAQGYASLAQLYGALGEEEKAIQAIKEALRIDPQNRSYQTIFNELGMGKP